MRAKGTSRSGKDIAAEIRPAPRHPHSRMPFRACCCSASARSRSSRPAPLRSPVVQSIVRRHRRRRRQTRSRFRRGRCRRRCRCTDRQHHRRWWWRGSCLQGSRRLLMVVSSVAGTALPGWFLPHLRFCFLSLVAGPGVPTPVGLFHRTGVIGGGTHRAVEGAGRPVEVMPGMPRH